MTPPRDIRNVPASVHQRLLNLARDRGIGFNVLLQHYVAERFLYRLSISDQVDRFTLKGAALFRVWAEGDARQTRDVDFLAFGPDDHAAIRAAVANICSASCPEDGVIFDPGSIRLANIRESQPYAGLRTRIRGNLGRTRLHLQVDIGFGDTIFPEREVQNYPTLLDLPAPRLWTYPRETVVAEKLHAMVEHDALNTRVKDLWDIACLARRFAFSGEVLRTAIAETFRRRATSFTDERPMALFPAYYEDALRERLWQKLQRGLGDDADGPARLVDAGMSCGVSWGRSATVSSRSGRSRRCGPPAGHGGRGFRPGREVRGMVEVTDRIGEARLGRFRRYPEYRDSGVGWLGEIPAHWEPKALKRLFQVVNGSTPKSSERDNWDGDIPWITPDDLGRMRERTLKHPAAIHYS